MKRARHMSAMGEYSIEDAEPIYSGISPSSPETRMSKRIELGHMALRYYPHEVGCVPLVRCMCVAGMVAEREAWLIEMLNYYGLVENYREDVAEIKRKARAKFVKRRQEG